MANPFAAAVPNPLQQVISALVQGRKMGLDYQMMYDQIAREEAQKRAENEFKRGQLEVDRAAVAPFVPPTSVAARIGWPAGEPIPPAARGLLPYLVKDVSADADVQSMKELADWIGQTTAAKQRAYADSVGDVNRANQAAQEYNATAGPYRENAHFGVRSMLPLPEKPRSIDQGFALQKLVQTPMFKQQAVGDVLKAFLDWMSPAEATARYKEGTPSAKALTRLRQIQGQYTEDRRSLIPGQRRVQAATATALEQLPSIRNRQTAIGEGQLALGQSRLEAALQMAADRNDLQWSLGNLAAAYRSDPDLKEQLDLIGDVVNATRPHYDPDSGEWIETPVDPELQGYIDTVALRVFPPKGSAGTGSQAPRPGTVPLFPTVTRFPSRAGGRQGAPRAEKSQKPPKAKASPALKDLQRLGADEFVRQYRTRGANDGDLGTVMKQAGIPEPDRRRALAQGKTRPFTWRLP